MIERRKAVSKRIFAAEIWREGYYRVPGVEESRVPGAREWPYILEERTREVERRMAQLEEFLAGEEKGFAKLLEANAVEGGGNWFARSRQAKDVEEWVIQKRVKEWEGEEERKRVEAKKRDEEAAKARKEAGWFGWGGKKQGEAETGAAAGDGSVAQAGSEPRAQWAPIPPEWRPDGVVEQYGYGPGGEPEPLPVYDRAGWFPVVPSYAQAVGEEPEGQGARVEGAGREGTIDETSSQNGDGQARS